jgi:hypothetical protein
MECPICKADLRGSLIIENLALDGIISAEVRKAEREVLNDYRERVDEYEFYTKIKKYFLKFMAF